jgi:RNA polymerase sigma-70 factor (ECF subfamily)
MNSIDPLRLESFSNLVREHQARLRAFIRALGVEAESVDDLAQETFVIAFQKMDHFETDKDFGRWLRGIARNLVANERRKNARHTRILAGPFTDLMLETKPSAIEDDTTEPSRLIDAMNDCIGKLPERSRQLLHKRYAAEHNASVLSTLFNMRPDAIRQSLSRIRAWVKQCIEAKLVWR